MTGIFAVLAVALVAGVANALPPQKLVRGVPAAAGEFPYQVSLRVRGQHTCGGAIIAPRKIMTAAHCVATLPETPVVVTGALSITGGQVHTVAKIVYNRRYNVADTRSHSDLAIVFLTADIPFNQYQNKIALPTAETPADVSAVVSGWGQQTAQMPLTAVLLKLTLTTISPDTCQQMFGTTSTIYQNQVCTYNGPGVGTCVGDSGGPLAYNNQLVGIVSWGYPCATGYPDVYTSVFHHLKWINEVLAM